MFTTPNAADVSAQYLPSHAELTMYHIVLPDAPADSGQRRTRGVQNACVVSTFAMKPGSGSVLNFGLSPGSDNVDRELGDMLYEENTDVAEERYARVTAEKLGKPAPPSRAPAAVVKVPVGASKISPAAGTVAEYVLPDDIDPPTAAGRSKFIITHLRLLASECHDRPPCYPRSCSCVG